MKKTTIVLAMLAFVVLAAYAGQSSSGTESADQKSASSTANPPLRTIAGKISDDGKTFTADKDGKQWTLKNPEDVKGHEGHHVKLQAHVYMDTNELHVVNLTMINQKAGKKNESQFKPLVIGTATSKGDTSVPPFVFAIGNLVRISVS